MVLTEMLIGNVKQNMGRVPLKKSYLNAKHAINPAPDERTKGSIVSKACPTFVSSKSGSAVPATKTTSALCTHPRITRSLEKLI
jgi:hypothetical protein